MHLTRGITHTSIMSASTCLHFKSLISYFRPNCCYRKGIQLEPAQIQMWGLLPDRRGPVIVSLVRPQFPSFFSHDDIKRSIMWSFIAVAKLCVTPSVRPDGIAPPFVCLPWGRDEGEVRAG